MVRLDCVTSLNPVSSTETFSIPLNQPPSKERVPIPATTRSFGCASVGHLVKVDAARKCGVDQEVNALSAPVGLVGLNHRTASAALRNQVAIATEAVPQFIARAREAGASECAVLSTCNRTEIYYAGVDAGTVLTLLADHAGLPVAELESATYKKMCACAACHLFRVAAGLDSAVLGETEIVAQVKESWRVAVREGMSGPGLDLLFPRALETSKRIRTETDLCRSVTSTASLAVRHIQITKVLSESRVAVLGAGQIAERVMKELVGSGAKNVAVLNRSLAKAQDLVNSLGGVALPLSALERELVEADAMVACLSVEHPVITQDLIDAALPHREGRPLLIIDMGVPANVAQLEGVQVVTVDQLASECTDNQSARLSAVPPALQILDQELQRYGQALLERAAAPTIQALVQHGEQIKSRNLEWAKDRLAHLDQKELRVVEELARRMMIGLLQEPIEGLKREFSGEEHRAQVERLFGLGGTRDS
jgi:glutamyl-tRNA reductase